MNPHNNYGHQFNRYLQLMVVIVAMLMVSFLTVYYEQSNYEKSLEKRNISIGLAEELRQSSNDLTRLARTYISTGDLSYKIQFNELVAIRDGLLPRPINYNFAYWDLKSAHRVKNESNSIQGQKVPLLILIERAGIEGEDLKRLIQAKLGSDKLVKVEKAAMQLIDPRLPLEKSKLIEALSMLASADFLLAKANVMQSIVEAEQSINYRTQWEVNNAQRRLQLAIASLFILGILLIYLIVKVNRQLRIIIGGSISELYETIGRLGRGDFMTPIVVNKDDSGSVLAWVSKTQRELAELNLVHFKSIIDSSDDAIISKSVNGIISSWNKGAEKIFGYSADEIIGQPMLILVPDDRRHEEPEILLSIINGIKVDHFETKRCRKDGSIVDVSVTISPIYDVSGNVIGASKIARDITKAKEAEAEIKQLAFYDVLTGLANRRLLLDRLGHAVTRAQRDNLSIALLFLDLDNFKKINDTNGHEAGDELLREVANRLRGCVRASDTISRFGGDEFVILLEGGDLEKGSTTIGVEVVVRKIISKFQEPFIIFNNEFFCTTSVGASIYSLDLNSSNDLLVAADRAMYFAKKSGKNCYKIIINKRACE